MRQAAQIRFVHHEQAPDLPSYFLPPGSSDYVLLSREFQPTFLKGDQVRVALGGDDPALQAVFTVFNFLDVPGKIVYLNPIGRFPGLDGAIDDGKAGRKHQDKVREGFIQGPVVVYDGGRRITDSEAKYNEEFVERLHAAHKGTERTQLASVLLLAPHGGDIDVHTDQQVERMCKRLSAIPALKTVSWLCKGWRRGGKAYEKWHITSRDLSPRSFPLLNDLIITKGNRFDFSFAMHGMKTGGILIGGRGPLDLKLALQVALDRAIDDDKVPVRIATWQDDCNGLSRRNVVNWTTKLGLGGIQIEQDKRVRSRYWGIVADTICDTLISYLAFEDLTRDDEMTETADLLFGDFCA